jgi:tetratricopeptide (TPR) repeat protein
VDRRQSHLARLHRDLCRRLTAARIEKGDAEGARAVAERWAEMDPLDDEAHHRIIDLLARTGRRSQALRHYEEYRELIARELEVEPLDQTRELVARMREGEAAPGRAREQSEAPLRNAPPEPRPPPVAATAAPTHPEIPSVARPRDRRTTRRAFAAPRGHGWLLGSLAAILVAAMILLWGGASHLPRTAAADEDAGLDPRGIAVLPFVNMSADLEQEYFYLQGREYYRRFSKRENELAIELFRRALEEDPSYALAYAGIADA